MGEERGGGGREMKPASLGYGGVVSLVFSSCLSLVVDATDCLRKKKESRLGRLDCPSFVRSFVVVPPPHQSSPNMTQILLNPTPPRPWHDLFYYPGSFPSSPLLLSLLLGPSEPLLLFSLEPSGALILNLLRGIPLSEKRSFKRQLWSGAYPPSVGQRDATHERDRIRREVLPPSSSL